MQELVCGIARLPVGKRLSRPDAQMLVMLDEDFAGQVAAYDGEAAASYSSIRGTLGDSATS
ncbi:MAG: hypothetical protein Q8M20_07500 [Rhodocyclaceae bacterium]|nr:hypothetical protein [Rhodocyclaceae bacterium]MDZ4214251.1 hypothetical protein [Rhodocyclaceae bacterium]